MAKLTLLILVLVIAVALAPTVAFGTEAVIFSEEVPAGASLEALHADSQFVVSSDSPHAGSNHLKRDIAAGGWAWITGISGLNLDLTDINFDVAFIEFYIDSGTSALGYIELRIAGVGWSPDSQVTIATDDVEGYEQIHVMLTDFNVKQLGHSPANLDEFTGGTGKIDTWSIGFGAVSDVLVDEIIISDGISAAVDAEDRLITVWGKLKSE